MVNKKLILPIILAVLLFVNIGASAAATNEFNTTQITKSAGNVKLFVDEQKRLPNTVSIYNTGNVKQSVKTPQFLYLLAQATQNLNKNFTTPIKLKSVATAPKPSESLKISSLTKAQYLARASTITSYINKNKRAPNFASQSTSKIRYENLIYTYSKILNYYGVNGRLPNTVSVSSWSTLTNKKIPSPMKVTDTSKAKVSYILGGPSSAEYIQKIGPYGNSSSKNKVAVIVGVHPLEGNAHLSMENALKSESSKLKNVQIWLFKIKVNPKYYSNYENSRSRGQNLANKYVVPLIGTSYKFVIDTHGNRGNYKYNGNQIMTDFIFAPLKDTKSVTYAKKIVSKTSFLNYHYVAGTSPDYVTKPIARKGIPTVVYELYTNIPNYSTALYKKSVQVVKAINSIFA